jgi:hypothetical protein
LQDFRRRVDVSLQSVEFRLELGFEVFPLLLDGFQGLFGPFDIAGGVQGAAHITCGSGGSSHGAGADGLSSQEGAHDGGPHGDGGLRLAAPGLVLLSLDRLGGPQLLLLQRGELGGVLLAQLVTHVIAGFACR